MSIPTGSQLGLKGTGYKSVGQFSPEQLQLFRQMFGSLGPESFLGKLSQGSPEFFEQMESPAHRQFAGLQGQLASRFSAGGGGPSATSARRSSGFFNASNEAAREFAESLQAQRLGLQQQAIKDLQSLSGQLLQQRPFAFIPKKKSNWQEFLMGLSGGIGQGLGSIPGLFF